MSPIRQDSSVLRYALNRMEDKKLLNKYFH